MKYEIEISDINTTILLHDLADIKDWVDKAIAGKIAHCRKRMAFKYREIAKVEGMPSIPVSDEECAKCLCSRKDYINRAAREKLGLQ